MGELHSKRGIFPVNYTEDYNSQAQPLPPFPDNTTTTSREIVEEKPRSEPEPQQQRTLPESTSKTIPHQISNPRIAEAYQSDSSTSSASTRRPPPPPSSVTVSSSPSVSSTLKRKGSTAIRAPPPPPLVHNIIETHDNNNTVMIESPHSLGPCLDDSCLPPSIQKPCIECECHDFIENLFKKGYCNSCFHKHDE